MSRKTYREWEKCIKDKHYSSKASKVYHPSAQLDSTQKKKKKRKKVNLDRARAIGVNQCYGATGARMIASASRHVA